MKKLIYVFLLTLLSNFLYASEQNPVDIEIDEILEKTKYADSCVYPIDDQKTIFLLPVTLGKYMGDENCREALSETKAFGYDSEDTHKNQVLPACYKTWFPENKGMGAFAICDTKLESQSKVINSALGYVFLAKSWEDENLLKGGIGTYDNKPTVYMMWKTGQTLDENMQETLANSVRKLCQCHITAMVEQFKIPYLQCSFSLQTFSSEGVKNMQMMEGIYSSLNGNKPTPSSAFEQRDGDKWDTNHQFWFVCENKTF